MANGGSNPNARPASPTQPVDDRLDTWGEIAAYRKVEQRAAQRWQEIRDLPIYRQHESRSARRYRVRDQGLVNQGYGVFGESRRTQHEQGAQDAYRYGNEGSDSPPLEFHISHISDLLFALRRHRTWPRLACS